MAMYLVAMVLSIPNTVARCRGRRRRRGLPRAAGRRVAVRGWRSGRRHDPVSQFSLTAGVVMAVCLL